MRRAQRLRKLARAAVEAGANRMAIDLVPRTYYSPLPDVDRLPPALWKGPRPTPAVDLCVDDAIEFLRQDLARYLREFRPRSRAEGYTGFFVDNGTYESVDAETLYAIIRFTQPSRLIELGSGASSHVIALARRASGQPFEHIIYDPFPFSANPMGAVNDATVCPIPVQEIDVMSVAAALQPNDILFVDTTHTVKTGGDVNRIILELLPSLGSGVWIHIHDIFLPYEYPREWVLTERRVWAEQYLLQAFLAFNNDFEVRLPMHAVARTAPGALTDLIPSFGPNVAPGAFWLRRR